MVHFFGRCEILVRFFVLKKWQMCHPMCVPLVGYCMIYNKIIMSSIWLDDDNRKVFGGSGTSNHSFLMF